MVRMTALVLLASLLLSGCAKRKPATRTVPETPAGDRLSPEALRLIEAAGDRATLVVVLHPDRFRPAAQTLKPLLSGLKSQWKEDALGEKDLFSSAARGAGLSYSKLKLLRAWDRSRPMVAGLFEPLDSDLVLSSRALIPVGREDLVQGVPGIRHRVLVPARFPRALAEVFAEMAESKKLKRVEGSASLEVLKNGSLFELPGGDGFLALVPEEDYVRCEVLTGDNQMDADAAGRLLRYASLIGNGSRRKPALTPALMALASRTDLLLVHVRPRMFRELGSLMGVQNMVRAVATVPGDMTLALLAQGMAEVATGYLLMSPAGAEMDDLTLGLQVDKGLRLSFMGSLTERGRAIFQAGLHTDLKPPRATDLARPILSSWTGLDLNAMLKSAPTPPALSRVKNFQDLGMRFMVCGTFCNLHFLLRSPFGLGRAALDLAGPLAWSLVPRAFGFALQEVNGPQTRVAAAALFPADANLGLLKTMLSQPPLKAELLIEPQGDAQLAMLGMNTNPREVFNQTQSRFTPGLIGELEMDLQAVARGLGLETEAPEVLALLSQLKPLRLRSLFGGRSVQAEMIVNLQGHKPMGFEDPVDTTGMTWESPGAKDADTPGTRCLEQLTRDMIEAYQSLAAVSPDFKTVILERAFLEAKPSLECALGQPDTRDTARKIQFAQNIYLAGQYAEKLMPERQLQILDQTCQEGSRRACDLARNARANPAVYLARIKADCLDRQAPGELILHLRPGKEQPAEGQERHGTYQLAVDQQVRFKRFMELINQLVVRGHGRADLLVRTHQDQVRRIPLELPAPKGPMQPMELKPIWMAVNQDGSVGIGQGSKPVKSFKEGKEATDHLAKVLKQEGSGSKIMFGADPEATMERIAPLLAAATCAQDPESRKPLTLARPIGVMTNIEAKGSLLGLIGKGSGTGIGRAHGGFKVAGVLSKGVISKQAIRQVVKKNQKQVRHCYEKSLVGDPKLAGTVRVKFVIAPSGKVASASISNSTVKNKEMENCLLQKVRLFKFPKVKGGSAVVTYPFVFKSK